MRLITKKDIDAPVAFVYKFLTDFDSLERHAMRRGADVNRTDKLREAGPGMTWIVKFRYRGKERTVSIRVDAMDGPNQLVMASFSPVVERQCKLDLLEMAAKRTRLQVTLDSQPKSFAARLFFQSLKLAMGRLERNLKKQTAHLAAEIEARYQRETASFR